VDTKLEKAFEIANYMASLAAQKYILKEEYCQALIFYHNGGTFTATRELINFVKTLVDLTNSETSVLVDNNDIPIDIENLSQFLELALSKYTFAVNGYYTKYSQLRKSKSVESLMRL
jgi:hypothetical protein